MVVGDHDFEPLGAGLLDRPHRGDAAVAGEDQAGSCRSGGGDARGTEVVPVANPMGEKGDDAGPRGSERAGEERGGALAIDIVIAVNQNPGPRANRAGNGRHGFRHARKRQGVRQLLQRGPEESTRRLRGLEAPAHQEASEGGSDAEPDRQRSHHEIGRWIVHDPPQGRNREGAIQRSRRHRG